MFYLFFSDNFSDENYLSANFIYVYRKINRKFQKKWCFVSPPLTKIFFFNQLIENEINIIQ